MQWKKLSRDNAAEYLRAYVEQSDASLERFRQTLKQLGFDESQHAFLSPESLRSVWHLVYPKLKLAKERPVEDCELPMWYDIVTTNNQDGKLREPLHFVAETAWLIDGLTYYLAACIRAAAPDVDWVDFKESNTIWSYRPVLENSNHCDNPMHPVMVLALKATRKPELVNRDQFLRCYERMVAEFVHKLEIADSSSLLGVSVESVNEGECNYSLEFHDGLESALGETKFQQLPQRLHELSTVEEISQEDREVFYVKSSATANELVKAVESLLDSMRK